MSRGQERRRNLAQWLNEASPLKLLSAEEVTEPGWYCWRGREGEKSGFLSNSNTAYLRLRTV